jgi:hypothetical protein
MAKDFAVAGSAARASKKNFLEKLPIPTPPRISGAFPVTTSPIGSVSGVPDGSGGPQPDRALIEQNRAVMQRF